MPPHACVYTDMRTIALVLLAAGSVLGAAGAVGPERSAAASAAARLPVAFEPNRGQEPGGAEFLARGAGYRVALSSGRAEVAARGARAVLALTGARPARGEAEDRLPGVANYLRGWDASRAINGIPTFARVRYRGVYPGIDTLWYGSGGRLEFDFVVAPGADPGCIRMRFENARTVRVDAAGDLVIETAGGPLRQHRPAIYQNIGGTRRAVAGGYTLRGNEARIRVAAYDRRRELVIDPVLSWATFFGSAGTDTGEAVAADAQGNVYLTGASPSASGYSVVYISKLSPDGKSASTATIGGSYDNIPHAIVVDSTGSVHVTGETDTATYYGTVTQAFVARFDASLNTVYAMAFGGSYSQTGLGIAVDSSGNAYVAGATNSYDFPVSTGPQYAGGADVFIVKFDATGAGVSATLLGGSADDFAYSIALDAAGNIYVAGTTASASNFPVTQTALQPRIGGGTDAFIVKLGANLSLLYSTYLGGSGDDTAYGIAVDPNGAVYIAGQTKSADFPAAGASKQTLNGSSDAFVAKLKADGSALGWSTLMGGSGDDVAYALALDGGGNLYFTGATTSADFPLSDAFQTSLKGTSGNAIVAALAGDGTPLFSSYLGGSGSPGTGGDYGNAVAVNCSTGLLVAGTTASSDFPATAGVVRSTYTGGNSDAFVARIAAGGGVPAINTNGVVNGANYTLGAVAPGSLVVLYGVNLAPAALLASATPLPAGLLGTTVTVNGTAAPFFYASAGQLNIQVPYEVAPGPATVTVNTPCGASAQAAFQVAQAAPYLFQQANGDAIAYNQDNTLNTASNPAAAGSAIVVYLTGMGPIDTPLATGAAAVSGKTTLPYSATIGGWSANPFYLGVTPTTAGVGQANMIVPGLSAGVYPVKVTVGGVESNGPNVYVK